MAKKKKSVNDLETISNLLKNLLAIELYRSGLSQPEIGKRLGIATGSVNSMLKGVCHEVTVIVSTKDKKKIKKKR